MSEPRNFMALDWVKGEIEETLHRAREALEAFADAPDDPTLARQCLTGLHQVHGTLQMVELTGAATLAGEMEALAQALMNGSTVDEERAQEALMEGILQLPSHLNRVHRGAVDDPRVHALLMDRMRMARGAERQASTARPAVDPETVAAFMAGDGPTEIRKVRGAYQKAMVALLRGKQPPGKMYQFFDRAFTRLEELVPASPTQQLWALAGVAMEAAQSAGAEPKVTLPLLRGLDQQLKDLAGSPEAALVAQPVVELVEQITDFIAASGHASQRLDAVQAVQEGADEPLPVILVGADDETIAMVAAALHEELASVRDRLDLFVRGSVADAEGLHSLGADLQRVAGTLQVAGLDALRETVVRQVSWLQSQASATGLDEEAIMEVASAVLYVDGELMRLAGIDSEDSDGMPGSLSDAQTAVLREARASLEAVKQGIVDFIASDWEHAHLERVPGMLDGVGSVLGLVPLEQAATLVEQSRTYLEAEVLGPRAIPAWQRLDTLADAITSIDYYLERLIEDRVIPDPRLLEIAEASMAQLRADASALSMDEASLDARPVSSPTAAPREPGLGPESSGPQPGVGSEAMTSEMTESDDDLDATSVRAPDDMPDIELVGDAGTDEVLDFDLPSAPDEALDVSGFDFDLPQNSADDPAGPDAERAFDGAASVAAGQGALLPMDDEPTLVDEEIVEIFLEEVVEVMSNLDAALPKWSADPSDAGALGDIRRAFHTLKGSGRMVGANLLGELAWSVENMLNRVIDGTISASPTVLDLTHDVRALVPEMRNAFSESRDAVVDVTPWMERADLLASGGTADELPELPAAEEALLGAAPNPAAILDDESDQPDDLAPDGADAIGSEGYGAVFGAGGIQSSGSAHDPLDFADAPDESLAEESSAVIESAAPLTGDEPSALSAPVEDDFDLGLDLDHDLDLADTESEVSALAGASAAEMNDDLGLDDDLALDLDTAALRGVPDDDEAPSVLAPANDDFGPLATGDETGAAPPPGSGLGRDMPSSLSAPVEDDFDLGLDGTGDSEGADDTDEPSLFEIFEQEAQEHLAVMRSYVEAARSAQGVAPLSEGLRRAIHTIKGSSAMADYPGISEIAAPLERVVRGYMDLHRNSDLALSNLVAAGLARIEAGLASLRDTGSELPLSETEREYLDKAHALLKGLEKEVPDSAHAGVKPSPRDIFAADSVELLLDATEVLGEWAAAGVTTRVGALRQELTDIAARARPVGQDAIAGLADALRDAHERVGPRLGPIARPVFERAHDALVDTLDALAADMDVPAVDENLAELAMVGPEPAVAISPVLEPEALPVAEVEESVAGLDLDPEMVEIFFEEAEEILEMVERALDAWPLGSASAADELLRALHTLKGGARMAGLTGLGEEAHDLESWIAERRANPDATFFSSLRERADIMAEHVAMLRRGETIVLAPPARFEVPVSAPDEDVEPITATDAGTLESSMQRSVPEPEHAGKVEAVAQAPGPAAAVRDAIDADVVDTDAEILGLFLEEAKELTEMLDGSLQGWCDEPTNEIHMESALRALHTLKGGARMAGLMNLGERVHDLETRVIERRAADEALDAQFLAGVQSEVDALSARIAALGGAVPSRDTPSDEPSTAGSTSEGPSPPNQAMPEPVAEAPTGLEAVEALPASAPEAAASGAKDAPQEMIRVSAGLLDELVNLAGETSIMRGRVQQQISDFGVALDELSSTIERLGEQIRRLDSEAQEQVLSRQEAAQRAERAGYDDFDPLEMDRYTQLQELTRTLAESTSDVSDLRDTLAERIRDTDTLLVQQARINTELQEGLMRTRMVPFARLLPRLKRIVRQVGRELGKPVDLTVENAEGEVDRNILERMIAPLEHMLRNAVDHGLETPEIRAEVGKPSEGMIRLRLDREGGDILIRVSDDGGGINVDGVRAKAIERGLLDADVELADGEVLSFIMAPGFSTAKSVTQISGRGVGMDVVNSEVKQLGGTIAIGSKLGEGTTFTVRLPFTVSVNRALLVHVGSDVFAVPLNGVEGIVRVSPTQLIARYEASETTSFSYAGRDYALSYLGEWLGDPRRVVEDVPSVPIIMVRSGDMAMAVHVDSIVGSREVVVKSLGGQFAGIGGVSGATIMGDGSVVVILDLPALLRSAGASLQVDRDEPSLPDKEEAGRPGHVMVVDDSVTVRKVTTRLLERRGYRVSVAKDGVEAVAALTGEKPDVMLLDIEMPRMDGFEVATHVRNDNALRDLPIIMITSRTGDKHRARAEAIGVNRFLGKPFQEPELLAEIETLIS
ncbi:MAG: Hpt domain-containing protein [Pseudomonadota bacterium]|nr:Hpt domain-containing protein [Pseudomonadota bacterium]